VLNRPCAGPSATRHSANERSSSRSELRLQFGGTHWDREREGRPLPDLALDPDPPPVQLDELPAEGQPQPSALGLLVRSADLAELFEGRFLVLGRNADPSILHRDLNRSVTGSNRDLDAATLGGELDRVGEQIQDNLPDLPLVRLNLPQPLIDVRFQGVA